MAENKKAPKDFMKKKMYDVTITLDPQDLMVLKVKKPGGLAQGYHDLQYGYCFTSSYMPPFLQSMLDPDKESMVFLPEFGKHVNSRRLLIV